MVDIVKKVYSENKVKRFFEMLIGITLAAIAFNVFLLPNNIVFGGVSGLSIVAVKLFNISSSLFVLLADIVLLIISFIFLGKEKTIYSICGSLLFPVMMYLTSNIGKILSISSEDLLLSSIMGGVLYGAGVGIAFKAGYSTGGTDVIKQLLNKYLNISMGNATLIADGFIVLIGAFVFGWTKFMYAMIIVYLISMLTDRMILGISDKKAFYIITEKKDEISSFIINELHHSVTILDAKGGYSNSKNPVLFTVIPTKEYFKFKEGINHIDKKAFWTVIDAYEVLGGE